MMLHPGGVIVRGEFHQYPIFSSRQPRHLDRSGILVFKALWHQKVLRHVECFELAFWTYACDIDVNMAGICSLRDPVIPLGQPVGSARRCRVIVCEFVVFGFNTYLELAALLEHCAVFGLQDSHSRGWTICRTSQVWFVLRRGEPGKCYREY